MHHGKQKTHHYPNVDVYALARMDVGRDLHGLVRVGWGDPGTATSKNCSFFTLKNSDYRFSDLLLKPYLCEYCKKSFTIKDNLKRHIKLAHQAQQNLKPHKCIECEKTFSWKQGLHRHVSTAHSKLKPSKPVEVEEKKAEVDVIDLDSFSKDDEDQFKALLSEEKSSENMVILKAT